MPFSPNLISWKTAKFLIGLIEVITFKAVSAALFFYSKCYRKMSQPIKNPYQKWHIEDAICFVQKHLGKDYSICTETNQITKNGNTININSWWI